MCVNLPFWAIVLGLTIGILLGHSIYDIIKRLIKKRLHQGETNGKI
jgi:xanthosine utilization system XapX-like protein